MKWKYHAAALGTAFAAGFYIGAKVTVGAVQDRIADLTERTDELTRRVNDTIDADEDSVARWYADHPIVRRVEAEERARDERSG